MSKDLTVSDIERQNILNNPYAIEEIEKATNLEGIHFEGKLVFLKEQLATFFEVTPRTIDRYLVEFETELKKNGYEALRGKRLQILKKELDLVFGNDINVVTKTTVLGIFDFRAFLNLGMLMKESEKARLLRTIILDIVIDTLNQKTGGGTKYINQRDEDFIVSYFEGENYRKEFTDALKDYCSSGNFKYAVFTDKVYKSIFKENASEYRKILKLQNNDKLRDTFYAEILDLIAAYECAFAKKLKLAFQQHNRKLHFQEVDSLYQAFEAEACWSEPLVKKARNKMASRDLVFRDALHHNLKNYITPLHADDFERFLGEKSKELLERMEETKEVFQRLKERD
jgi:hypothetical protein